MKKLILLLPILALLFSCSSDDSPQDNPTGNNRTVLMYLIAENNLNNYGNDFYSADSAEIAIGAKMLKDNEKLLAFIDRNNAMPKIVLFTNKGPQIVKTYNERFYSTDPERMKEVMQWVVANYPANSYGLTFWGHGTSWLFDNDGSDRYTQARKRALGYDTSSQSSFPHWINIPDLAKTIASGMPHLDFIFFDCCNMQAVEVAYELRKTTDYIIGSPAEIPGCGAPYKTVVKDFFLDKDKVGETLVYDYVANTDFTRLENRDYKKVAGLPLSVIRTDALDNLALATKFALEKFMKNKPESAKVANCIYYMRDFKHYNNQPCLYDMRSVMRANISHDGFTEEDFKQWDAALSEAVYRPHIARVADKADWNSDFIRYSDFMSWQYTDENYGGISMFIPLEGYGEDGPIYSFSSSNQYYHSPNNLIHKMQWYNAVEWARYGW